MKMVLTDVIGWTTSQLGNLADFLASLMTSALTILFGAAYSGGFVVFILFCCGFGAVLVFVVVVFGKWIKSAFSFLLGRIKDQF